MRPLLIACALVAASACDDRHGAAETSPATASAAVSSPEPPAPALADGAPDEGAPDEGEPGQQDDTAPAKAYACGARGQTPCPMQGWMKQHVAKAVAKKDLAAVATHLTFIAQHPVEGYDDWVKIAEAGAAAAAADDLPGARNSCKGCHKLYQRRYKNERRDAPWP